MSDRSLIKMGIAQGLVIQQLCYWMALYEDKSPTTNLLLPASQEIPGGQELARLFVQWPLTPNPNKIQKKNRRPFLEKLEFFAKRNVGVKLSFSQFECMNGIYKKAAQIPYCAAMACVRMAKPATKVSFPHCFSVFTIFLDQNFPNMVLQLLYLN